MTEPRGSNRDTGAGDRSTNENGKNTGKKYLSPDASSMLEKSPSLQRLQNQSSTETSGLGETITSGFSSQESIASFRSGKSGGKDPGLGGAENSQDITDQKCSNSPVITQPMKDIYDGKDGRGQTRRCIGVQEGILLTAPSEDDTQVLRTESTDAEVEATNFDELFNQSVNFPIPQHTMGLQMDQIESEWGRHSRNSSIKSRASLGSFRSRSGSTRSKRGSKKFLGRNTESQWTKWSKERRASFRRRLELLDKPDPDIPERASTPVKKARQEGLKFIHPDLESKYISEEDINYIQRHRQQRLQTFQVIEKSNKMPYPTHHEMHRLTVYELNVLNRFWEHTLFIRSRYVSIILSFLTLVLLVVSVFSSYWISYPSKEIITHNAHEGLWRMCAPVFLDGSIEEVCRDFSGRGPRNSMWTYCYTIENSTLHTCSDSRPSWQNAVIGLMIFSAGFGFVAAVLAILGVCTSPLPKKIYYFHSAGEIFFVCALSTSLALIIYSIAIVIDGTLASHSYGSGYGLGWGGTVFFFAASFCMSLDELVREASTNKCCRWCWKSRTTDRTELQQV